MAQVRVQAFGWACVFASLMVVFSPAAIYLRKPEHTVEHPRLSRSQQHSRQNFENRKGKNQASLAAKADSGYP